MSTKQKLIQARKAIREKLRLLRLGQLKQEHMLRETFKPVTDSIKQISANSGKNNDDDDGVTNFFNNVSEIKLDKIYGVRKVRPYMLGTKPIRLTEDTIQIGDREFQRTQGLLNLIFLKSTTDSSYSTMDLSAYREIVLLTDLYRNTDGRLKNTHTIKYKNVIKPIVADNSSGDGIDIQHKSVTGQNPQYIYYNRPDDLVDRLRLLMASAAAGNTIHSNEVVSIISQLRERGIIE